ncbi:hypothetical protein GCM10017744_026910 [Streptomyces antimycoticus]|uniref:Uncharacterized protein n=1 Tax=Streptomyces antimycoticus TaxID=68175 RepID=A0A4D4KBZ1_9ACTN|nr:hypothetical protein SANT12839_075430 [Streptomyces antimycoticus]
MASETSATRAATVEPGGAAATVFRDFSSVRPTTITVAPSRAKRCAAAAPRLGPRNRRDHRLPRLVRAGYISGVTLPMDGGFMALGLAEQ